MFGSNESVKEQSDKKKIDTESVLQELEVVKLARQAGLEGRPATSAASLDPNELRVLAYYKQSIAKYRGDAISGLINLRQYREKLLQEAELATVDERVRNHHQAFNDAAYAIAPKNDNNLRGLLESEIKSDRYLRHFKSEHGLKHIEARYPDSILYLYMVIVVVAILEAIGLATLYKQVTLGNSLSGFLLALLISAINIVAAFKAGEFLRYLNYKKNDSYKGYLIALSILLMGLTLLVLFLAAHLRTAASEAIKNASVNNASMLDIFNIGNAAVDNLKSNTFALDGPSYLVLIGGIVFAIGVTILGFKSDDKYPGHGDVDRKHKNDKKNLSEYIDHRKTELRKKKEDVISNIDKLITGASLVMNRYIDSVGSSHKIIEEFRRDVTAHVESMNDVLQVYRAENEFVANSPRPAYFRERVVLDSPISDLLENIEPGIEDKATQFQSRNKELEAIQKQVKQEIESLYIEANNKYLPQIDEVKVEVTSNLRLEGL